MAASYNGPLLGGVPEGRGGFDPPGETLHPAVASRYNQQHLDIVLFWDKDYSRREEHLT